MKKITLSCVFLSFSLMGCNTYPVTHVSAVDSRPTLTFIGAPQGSLLYVDGISSGDPSQYNGNPNVLRVQPGTHEVQIMINNQVIFHQTVFVESENKVISVH